MTLHTYNIWTGERYEVVQEPPGNASIYMLCNNTGTGIGSDDLQCYCPFGLDWIDGSCKTITPRVIATKLPQPSGTCSAADPKYANPIFPMNGKKQLEEPLNASVGQESLRILYDTTNRLPVGGDLVNGFASTYGADMSIGLNASTYAFGDGVKSKITYPTFETRLVTYGGAWRSSLHRSIGIFGATRTGIYTVHVRRGYDGDDLRFMNTSGQLNGTFTPQLPLSRETLVQGTGDYYNYLYLTDAQGNVETYDAGDLYTGSFKAIIRSIDYAKGGRITFTYSDATTPINIAPIEGLLVSVQDETGRALSFAYEQPIDPNLFPRIKQMTAVDGRSTTFEYNLYGNLSKINYPDGKSRQFLYELTKGFSAIGAGNLLISESDRNWAVTGIIDENNVRLRTYSYNDAGYAIGTSSAGGVDSYSINWVTPPQLMSGLTQDPNDARRMFRDFYHVAPTGTSVLLPNGQVDNLSAAIVAGVSVATGHTQPAGSGCSASTSAIAYNSVGNVISKDDFTGQRTCFAYDAKNQETIRIEGLANTVDCASVLPANATLPANARKTTTTYHPDWRLPATVTMPGTITTRIYHGQPDPFNGNAVANCTAAPALPNGKPLPLVCKQVTQATLSSGALDSTVSNTVTQYTYNAASKVLTATDSLNRTSTYTYYPSTAFTGTDPNAVGNTVGDLMTITNPAGFVTTFNAYDKAGRILKMTDPKGIVTDMTYAPRGWVSTFTTTAPGQTARTTTYTYDGVGQLTGVSNPDGSTLAYTYDAAHRLVGVTDAKGNTVAYTLDNMGNRIKEDIKDPSGVLQRSINRSFDALNRLQQVSGAVQ